MHVDILNAPDMEHQTWADDKAGYIQSTVFITAIAASILTSAYFAYKNPGQWWLTTLSIVIINLYTLPKFLHYGNSTIIKLALVTNLIAISSVALGGIGAANVSFTQHMFSSFKTHQVSYALFSAFCVTGLTGYGIPIFREALERAYYLLQDADVQERLVDLQQQFHDQPEVGLGFLQCDVWQNFFLHLVLFKPKLVIELCQIFQIVFPDYAWPMVAAVSEKMTLEQFNSILLNMEHLAHDLSSQEDELPAETQGNYYIGLNVALQSLPSKDLPLAIQSLLSRGTQLVPTLLSNEQFLNLFRKSTLETTNDAIQTFLDWMDSWADFTTKYTALHSEVCQLEQEIQNQPSPSFQEEDDFNQRYEQLHAEYVQLRAEVEKTYHHKRTWQNVVSLWNDEDDLPFENHTALLEILNDQNLLKNVDDIYHTFIATGAGANRSLIDRLQYIKNKLISLHDEEKEEFSVIMYLAMNHGFITHDYNCLQEWLDLDSPHDLEAALTEIGLATEEDFYENDILPRHGHLSKTDILVHLRDYIKQAPKPALADRVERIEGGEPSLISTLSQKVTRFIFYAITSGLILAPIFVQPAFGTIGFGCGVVFFTLKRFGMPGTETIANGAYELLDSIPIGGLLYSLLNRPVFSLTPTRREAANHFVEADFFGRMRIINLHIFLVLFISHVRVRFDHPAFIGSFLQGLAFSNEVVNLV